MPAVFCRARLYLGKMASLSRHTSYIQSTQCTFTTLPLARPFSSTQLRPAAGRSTMVAKARGRALQELLDGKDEEKEESEGPGLPAVTTLSWESPLTILKYPDPRLRAPNAPVGCFDESLKKLAEEMFEVMYDDDGVGLAAPQVGANIRLMVFNETGDKEKRETEVVLVNPRIISSSKDAKVFEEGCLSFPNLYGDVIRPSKVRVRAQDLSGKSFVINISGFPARIFQHEYDHLQGTLFCDRLVPDALAATKKELVKMEEEFIAANPGVEVQRLS
jgi:peptide deformylase